MNVAEAALGVAAAVERDLDRLRAGATPLRALAELFVDEVFCSTVLAGSTMPRAGVQALLEREVVAAGFTLTENALVADYGEAARIVRAAAPARRGRPFLSAAEIATLHATAIRRTGLGPPGRWRERTAKALPSGMVPPPAWSIPREIAAFVERFAAGAPPGTNRLVWIADAHARFLRIRPFDEANGRTARLVTNVLLRRAELPPLVIRRADEPRYIRAVRLADGRDPWPLALVVARCMLATTGRLLAVADGDLRPLATFATGARRASLYKAAQRGRLRTVRERGALLTSSRWIAEYET